MLHPSACDYVFKDGIPEHDLIKWVKKEFGNVNHVLVDIGAHVGTYTCLLGDVFKHVYSFEPNKRNFYYLCANIVKYNLADKVTAYNKAVCATNGHLYLNIVNEDGGGNTLRPKVVENKNYTVLRKELVEATTLDDCHLEQCDFIKIDVEGAELHVLTGALNTIKKYRPVVLLEAWREDWYADERNEIIELMKSFNYKVRGCLNYPHMILFTQ